MPLLTLKEMQERVSQYKYKDWKIRLYEGAFEGLKLEVDATVEDSTKPGTMTRLHIVSPWFPCFDMKQFDYNVAKRLCEIETHETLENFKIEDKPVFDPHRPSGNRDILE